MQKINTKIAFFGGEPLGLPALEALSKAGLVPELVVCNPDRPRGRGQTVTAPRVKVWAQAHTIEVFQPISYQDKASLSRLTETAWDVFVVVAYNFILPKWFLELPKHGVINVHPSLLPKLRGASPIRSAILENLRDEIGVSIMLMDEKMDHGPILAQEAVTIPDSEWPMEGSTLDTILAQKGGDMLTATIPQWLAGNIIPTEQDHDAATYTKKFEKTDAEIFIDPNHLPTGETALKNILKIKAFSGMGDCFFMDSGRRVKIKVAGLLPSGQLEILRVTPEGKPEINFSQYLQMR